MVRKSWVGMNATPLYVREPQFWNNKGPYVSGYDLSRRSPAAREPNISDPSVVLQAAPTTRVICFRSLSLRLRNSKPDRRAEV
jgi:hypothetical protein